MKLGRRLGEFNELGEEVWGINWMPGVTRVCQPQKTGGIGGWVEQMEVSKWKRSLMFLGYCCCSHSHCYSSISSILAGLSATWPWRPIYSLPAPNVHSGCWVVFSGKASPGAHSLPRYTVQCSVPYPDPMTRQRQAKTPDGVGSWCPLIASVRGACPVCSTLVSGQGLSFCLMECSWRPPSSREHTQNILSIWTGLWIAPASLKRVRTREQSHDHSWRVATVPKDTIWLIKPILFLRCFSDLCTTDVHLWYPLWHSFLNSNGIN